MSYSAVRRMASFVLLLASPSAMMGAGSGAAMLYAHGTAWLNGSHVPHSSAIFSGDLVQTRLDSAANIHSPGSAVTILGDSLVRLEDGAVEVKRGSVSVSTSKLMAAIAGDLRIVPASANWTEFTVVDDADMVRITANKGDLVISEGAVSETLAQGQETVKNGASEQQGNDSDSRRKRKKRAGGAPPTARGGILDSTLAIGIGAGAIAGLTTWVLLNGDNPVSPSSPK